MFARLNKITAKPSTEPSGAAFRAAHLLALPRAEALGYDL